MEVSAPQAGCTGGPRPRWFRGRGGTAPPVAPVAPGRSDLPGQPGQCRGERAGGERPVVLPLPGTTAQSIPCVLPSAQRVRRSGLITGVGAVSRPPRPTAAASIVTGVRCCAGDEVAEMANHAEMPGRDHVWRSRSPGRTPRTPRRHHRTGAESSASWCPSWGDVAGDVLEGAEHVGVHDGKVDCAGAAHRPTHDPQLLRSG